MRSSLSRMILVAGFLLLAHASSAAARMPPGDDLGRLRELYVDAVERSEAVAPALEEVRRLQAALPAEDLSRALTLRAYEGAILTLRAKHGFWPPARLRHLREGLSVLDEVVAAAPDHAEARYLRLMSCYYLPGILGRTGSVRDDFAALARLLPGLREEYAPELYIATMEFVLENGDVEPMARQELRAALEAADE